MARADPSTRSYETRAHAILLRAIRAGRTRRGIIVWVPSPRRDFRRLDAGGRTPDERALTRALYKIVTNDPVAAQRRGQGPGPQWSLKLTWGSEREPSGGGRDARPVAVRIFPRSQARVRRGQSWVDGEGFGRSGPGRRIDSGRRPA